MRRHTFSDYRLHMRDSASKAHLRDAAPTRADLTVITWIAVLLAGMFIAGWLKP